MKRRLLAAAAVFISAAALLVLVCLLGTTGSTRARSALAAPSALVVTGVDPADALNDLDTSITITGTEFVSKPTVYLGNTTLDDVIWVSSATLEATVPWGMTPGVYTLTVENPGGESASLTDAFTVTEGIGVWNAGELYGGSVEEIVINPVTPTVLYAMSERVGLFRSLDGADHWSYVASGTDVRSLAIDPANPDTLYVSMSGPVSTGLHRSDDAGDTWTPLNAPGDIPFPHPTDSGTLFVSNRWEGESGLWKSTDSGQTWVTKTMGLTDTRVNNLVFDPTDPLTMYVGTELGNLFVSSDGGDNWSFVDRPTDLIQVLAINPRGEHELWVSNACFATTNQTLKSTNIGHTAWMQVADPVGSDSIGTIVFAPQAWGGEVYSDTLFVSNCWGQAHRSDDGGSSWVQFGPTTGEWGLVLHSSNPAVAYRSSEWDGVIRSTDGGANWQVANDGLTALVPEQLEPVPGEPGTLYAITERPDGIYKSTRGGETWQFLSISDGWGFDSMLVDSVTPTRVYAGRGDSGRVLVHVSEDGGATWPITSVIAATEPYTGCPNFVNAIAGDASQPGRLLLGMEHFCMGVPGVHAGDLYYSTDAGLTWERATVSGTDTISPVVDIAHDALTPTIIYAATGLWDKGSGMLRSTDGGMTWEEIGTGIADLDFVTSIAVEPSPPYRVFAQSVWQGLYVSYNHGISWTDAIPWSNGGWVNDMLCTGDDPSMLYAATGDGLHHLVKSEETGVMWWEPANGLLGQVPVYSLATETATGRVILYAGTTGGFVQDNGAQAGDLAAGDGTLVNAGVYRYTTRSWQIYLPLVLRAQTP
jgi:photosystem II stability/assembly factor-like uncharacterized protein